MTWSRVYIFSLSLIFIVFGQEVHAAPSLATTTVSVSNCGDTVVTAPEQCDIPGEIGVYSTTIIGRQCDIDCQFGPYCGDGTLQTVYGEECDDGNNVDSDFCSALCIIEPAGSGGGGSGGGGSGGGGGSSKNIEDTSIVVEGTAYPNRQVNILLDGESVGSVTTDSSGDFEFSTETSPGAATLGFWSTDAFGTRSITYSTTFDVTQGAVTNVRGVLLPPTVRVNNTEIDPGDILTISGQSAPNKKVQIFLGDTNIEETTSNSGGDWSVAFDSSSLNTQEYILKARFVTGSGSLITESNFSTALTLFVGVEGRVSTPSDLNRDGDVNLIDFSILIFWWGTPGGDSDPPADISGDGTVALADFSILLFNWTG